MRKLSKAEKKALKEGLKRSTLGIILPTIRRAAPSLIASQIVSVQPMTAPIGGLAFYKARYGAKKTPLQEITERVWAEEDQTDDA